eukprot:86396-Chlamydomonas_euryale.AAC.24
MVAPCAVAQGARHGCRHADCTRRDCHKATDASRESIRAISELSVWTGRLHTYSTLELDAAARRMHAWGMRSTLQLNAAGPVCNSRIASRVVTGTSHAEHPADAARLTQSDRRCAVSKR